MVRPTTFPYSCENERDCPAGSLCYPASELEPLLEKGMYNYTLEPFGISGNNPESKQCYCTMFFAKTTDTLLAPTMDATGTCNVNLPYQTPAIIVILIEFALQLYVFRHGLLVAHALKKCNCFKRNTAGIALTLCISASIIQSIVPISYFLAFTIDDYWAYDSLRAIGFSVSATFTALAMGMVTFIWIKTSGGGSESKSLMLWKRCNYFTIFFGTFVNNFLGTLLGENVLVQQINLLVCLYYGITFLVGGNKITKVMGGHMKGGAGSSDSQKMEDNMKQITTKSRKISSCAIGFVVFITVFVGTSTNLNGGDGNFINFLMAPLCQLLQLGIMLLVINYVRFGSREKLAAAGYFVTTDWDEKSNLRKEAKNHSERRKSLNKQIAAGGVLPADLEEEERQLEAGFKTTQVSSSSSSVISND